MDIGDPKIVALRAKVTAAQEEFDWAVTFHEVWKPAASDTELHKRLGSSYATHAFLVTRSALRREMLLALMRIWDKSKGSVRIHSIVTQMDDKVLSALALERAANAKILDLADEMKSDLAAKATEAIELVKKYLEGGESHALLESLRRLRHKRLAHRDLAVEEIGLDATNAQIEEFLTCH